MRLPLTSTRLSLCHTTGLWVLVRSSFAGYLADWLLDAAAEYV